MVTLVKVYLGELETAVETLAYGLCFHSFSRTPKLPVVLPKKENVFCFIIVRYNLHTDGDSEFFLSTPMLMTTFYMTKLI